MSGSRHDEGRKTVFSNSQGACAGDAEILTGGIYARLTTTSAGL